MASIGLRNLRFGLLTEAADGTPSYAGPITPGKAVTCNVSITNNNATLYADDTLAESDTSFQSGTVTMGIDDDDTTTLATLLGHSVDSETGAMTSNVNDSAPYVGLGRIVTKQINNVYKYKVVFLYKVKFSEPSQEDQTKGESVEFRTPEIEGIVSSLANGKWAITNTFDTYSEASSYLDSLLAAPTSA